MSSATQRRRRGRGTGLRGTLVERDTELAAITGAIGKVRAGFGGVVAVEGPAGTGKSRLLAVAGDLARKAGAQVLGATASDFERDFPFGVAIQLLEPRWTTADPHDRKALLQGAARHAAVLLDDQADPGALAPNDLAYLRIHGLFWLVCNLALERSGAPLVMLIDDVHWADKPSLRFLAYLAARIADVPVLIVLALRPGEATEDSQALLALHDDRASTVLPLRPLTSAGVEALVRVEFPDADDDFCHACAQVTKGNPFLVVELLAQVRANGNPPNGSTAALLSRITPETVLHAVVARLGRMPPAAGALATAAAILGEGTSLRHAALLAEVDLESAPKAADLLAGVHMLRAGAPLSFEHPLIASAILASMPPLARGAAHLRAAAILRDERAPAELVAAHLASSPPGGDASVVEFLRDAARHAVATGSPETAVRHLERALAEPPEPDTRPSVVGELAEAEALAGVAHAVERLAEAIDLTTDRERRAELTLALGRSLYAQERFGDAATAFDSGLGQDRPDDGLAAELEALYISAGSLASTRSEAALARSRNLSGRIQEPLRAEQLAALAHIAARSSNDGRPRSEVRDLADSAWRDGAMLKADPSSGPVLPLLTAALLFVDELERGIEICESAFARGLAQDSPRLTATANYCRAFLLCEQGRIPEATADAQAADSGGLAGRQFYLPSISAALAFCCLQRGLLAEADAMLTDVADPETRRSLDYPWSLELRAKLRLAQQRPEDALRDATEAGRYLKAAFPSSASCAVPWRSTCALAWLALGDSPRAKDSAEAELAIALRVDATRLVIRDMRVLALAQRGDQGIELLRTATDLGSRTPPRLEQLEALVDLGGALRRANQRAEARGPLQKAITLSHELGAVAVLQRAQTELAATGARPRHLLLRGTEALTPRERRVAELAAQGLTTRQMAQVLFVTPKTIEYHIRHIYEKLDVRSRTDLARVLAVPHPSAHDADHQTIGP
jgi:DNA-binding NarL/FixJ family response regulator